MKAKTIQKLASLFIVSAPPESQGVTKRMFDSVNFEKHTER